MIKCLLISGYGSIREKCYSVTSRDSSCDDITSCLSVNSHLSVTDDGESIRSSWNSVCSTPTSQCVSPTENFCTDLHKNDDTSVISGTSVLENCSNEPVPPPRRSLEREPLTTESDNETPINSRLLSVVNVPTLGRQSPRCEVLKRVISYVTGVNSTHKRQKCEIIVVKSKRQATNEQAYYSETLIILNRCLINRCEITAQFNNIPPK